jgi:hypothetical protein
VPPHVFGEPIAPPTHHSWIVNEGYNNLCIIIYLCLRILHREHMFTNRWTARTHAAPLHAVAVRGGIPLAHYIICMSPKEPMFLRNGRIIKLFICCISVKPLIRNLISELIPTTGVLAFASVVRRLLVYLVCLCGISLCAAYPLHF